MSRKDKRPLSRSYRMDLAVARADVEFERKERIRVVNGKRVKQNISVLSPNQERINDAVRMSFQESTRALVSYKEIEDAAIDELEGRFELRGLNKKDLTDQQRRVRAAAIRQYMDEYICDKFQDPKIEMSLDELISESGITATRNFKQQIEQITDVVGKSNKKFKRDVVDMDTMTIIESSYKSVVDISAVEVVLDAEMAKHFPTLEDFLQAKNMPDGRLFRNKKKFIKRIVFHIDPSALPHIVAQGKGGYVKLFPERRKQYMLHLTYLIDMYVTSMQNAQNLTGLTDFTPERLLKKFGHGYAVFYEFLRQVFDPAIEDFNSKDPRNLSYLVQRGNSRVWQDPKDKKGNTLPITKLRLVVKNYEQTDRDGVDALKYYIALQVLEGSPELLNAGKGVVDILESIEPQLETELPGLTILAGKTIAAWLKEAEQELEWEQKLIEMFSKTDISDIYYDQELMSLISDKVDIPSYVTKPSECYKYLVEEIKVNMEWAEKPKRKGGRNVDFPQDKAFVQDVLESAIEHGINDPLNFFYAMFNYYRSKEEQRKDWRAVVNLWLTNGKYNQVPAGSTKMSVKGAGSGDIFTGIWDHEREILETDTEMIPLTIARMAELISDGHAKMLGAL